MSHIFQRPLCDMGKAYDYAFRPLVGDPDAADGGGCDTRPHRVELFSAAAQPGADSSEWRPFALCGEHEHQLRAHDARLRDTGRASRFRTVAAPGPGAGRS
jgi:hypothetical protein